MLFHTKIKTPLGQMVAVADGTSLVMLEFTDKKELDWESFGTLSDTPILASIKAELIKYFNGTLKQFKTPISFNGSHIQNSVWTALQGVPYGTTKSYSDISHAIRNPKATRAVASTIGKNPLCIIIPCHRVISKDGTLGGYSAGLDRKKKLLILEKNNCII